MDIFQASVLFKVNKTVALLHLKAMSKKFAISVVQNGPKKMD